MNNYTQDCHLQSNRPVYSHLLSKQNYLYSTLLTLVYIIWQDNVAKWCTVYKACHCKYWNHSEMPSGKTSGQPKPKDMKVITPKS